MSASNKFSRRLPWSPCALLFSGGKCTLVCHYLDYSPSPFLADFAGLFLCELCVKPFFICYSKFRGLGHKASKDLPHSILFISAFPILIAIVNHYLLLRFYVFYSKKYKPVPFYIRLPVGIGLRRGII